MAEGADTAGERFGVVEKRCVGGAGDDVDLRVRQIFRQPLCGRERHQRIVFTVDQQRRCADATELRTQVNFAQPVEASEQGRRIRQGGGEQLLDQQSANRISPRIALIEQGDEALQDARRIARTWW